MSGAAVGAVGDLVAAGKLKPAPHLSRSTLAQVLTELAQHYGPSGRITPSAERIAARTGLNAGNVRGALGELVRQGLAERELVGRHYSYRLPLVEELVAADELRRMRARGAGNARQGRGVMRAGGAPNRDLTVSEPRRLADGRLFLPGSGILGN